MILIALAFGLVLFMVLLVLAVFVFWQFVLGIATSERSSHIDVLLANEMKAHEAEMTRRYQEYEQNPLTPQTDFKDANS